MAAPIFVSYAHADQAGADALVDRLRELEAVGTAEIWFDRRLEIGGAWELEIAQEIDRAEIVVLLVSPSYLTSEFINSTEIPLIRKAVESRGVRVVPVILEDCLWRAHPYLGGVQAFDRGRALEAPSTRTFQRRASELVATLHRMVQTETSAERVREPASPEHNSTGDRKSQRGRTDESGLAFKGSQLQTQLYVNARQEELDAAILRGLAVPAATTLEWRSPLAADGFVEFRDAAFLRELGLSELAPDLEAFWPVGGPRWDALARAQSPDGRTGALLAEGKSYPAEMAGGGCKATEPARARIGAAFAATQHDLGLPEEPERWMGRFYQFANRLTYYRWLRRMGVEAWLVHVLFVNDPHGSTSEAGWDAALETMHGELGLSESSLEGVGAVMLPALDRTLVAGL